MHWPLRCAMACVVREIILMPGVSIKSEDESDATHHYRSVPRDL